MSTNRKNNRGFSLLEVVIALTILVLISGSVFAVLRGSIDTASSIRESQSRQQQIDGFLELCHHTFHQLPPQTILEARIREEEGKALPEIIFRNSPELLSWGNVTDLKAITVLGLRPQVGGRYSLALLRFNPSQDSLADPVAKAQPADWLVLVPDVKKVSWRFFERDSNAWRTVLPKGSKRPGAVELKLELPDLPEPIRMVFDIIPLALPVSENIRTKQSDT